MSKAKEIHELFLSVQKSLCFAESITGGNLATSIVQYSGCSTYFLGDVVAYSNQAKIDFLGVSEETLQKFGAVSREVVEQMAQGAKERFHADFALATSGIAGPDGGNKQKPVGTVFFAISGLGQTKTWNLHLQGDRAQIIEKVCQESFSKLFAFVQRCLS